MTEPDRSPEDVSPEDVRTFSAQTHSAPDQGGRPPAARRTAFASPDSGDYEHATQVFNLAAPAHPEAATTARTVAEVRAAVEEAAHRGWRVRVHTTGHGAAARPAMAGTVLIRTALAGGVTVDPRRRIARVTAGTQWDAVVDAAARYGLAAPHGTAATVGAVGYLLNGGISYYGREEGLAANALHAVELVTADGTLRRADRESDPDLFWALRGGGGGFGVVTAVEVGLFPASAAVTGAAYWPARFAYPLLREWLAWTRTAPRAATTAAQILNLPAIPGVPPMLAQGPVLCVDGAVLARTRDDVRLAERHADDLLRPLRAVADPILDTWQTTSVHGVLDAHMDPTDPVPVHGDHMLLSDPGDDGLREFLSQVGPDSASPLVAATLRQLGGACAEPDADGGVLDHIGAPFAYLGSGAPFGSVTPSDLTRRCARVRAALQPWDSGSTAPGFVESAAQPQGHLTADQVRRVDGVRHRVDPDGMFRPDIAPGASFLTSAATS